MPAKWQPVRRRVARLSVADIGVNLAIVAGIDATRTRAFLSKSAVCIPVDPAQTIAGAKAFSFAQIACNKLNKQRVAFGCVPSVDFLIFPCAIAAHIIAELVELVISENRT